MTAAAPRRTLVTGATQGIGFEIAAGLLRAGGDVLLLARTPARGAEAAERLRLAAGRAPREVLGADLASLEEVGRAAAALRERGEPLDALVLCAGVLPLQAERSRDGYELQIAVNHLAGFALVHDLRPLVASARVVVVSSDAHRHAADLPLDELAAPRRHDPLEAYRRSKLANVLFARALAARLAPTDGQVNAVHPGVVHTSLLEGYVEAERRPRGRLARLADAAAGWANRTVRGRVPAAPSWDWTISAAEAARTPLALLLDPAFQALNGSYLRAGQVVPPSPLALDDALAERCWRWSEERTGRCQWPRP